MTNISKKQKLVVNQLTFKLKPEHMETFVGKSQTVPDETLTMREIITRFSRTGQVDSRLDRRGVYTDNPSYDSPDMEELGKMDIYERQEVAAEMKQANQEKIDRIKQSIKDKEEKEKQQKLSSSKSKKEDGAPAATKNVPESSERANESTKQGTQRGDKGSER